MRNKILVFLLIGIFILSGCAMLPKKEEQKMGTGALLEPQTTLRFSDIPVPVGFKSIPQDSYSFESSGVRVGVLKYQGKANPDAVVNFYKEQMAMYSWNLVNIVEYGQRVLNFERENESCIISLFPKGNNVVITISIGPKSQVLPKKSKQPVK